MPQPTPLDTTAKDFIAGGVGKSTLPWQAPHVREDLMVVLNCKQPEKLMLMVEWLVDEIGITKRQGVETALREWCERELKRRGVNP